MPERLDYGVQEAASGPVRWVPLRFTVVAFVFTGVWVLMMVLAILRELIG